MYRGFADPRLVRRPRAVAVGVFDGLHRGHRRILSRLISAARASGLKTAVVTFDPHPLKVLRPEEGPTVLMSLPHRLQMFERLGIEEVLLVRFDRRTASTPPLTFVERDLAGRMGMRRMVVGYDFRFGRGGAGDARLLRSAAGRLGFTFEAVGPVRHGGRIVSSTRIRRLIETGRLALAGRLLGRPVSVRGTVVRGRRRGRRIGYPTANLNPHHEALPPDGVYAVWGDLDGRRLRGVVNVGSRPTFAETSRTLEAHFLDFDRTIYGREVELVFVRKLRAVKKFRSSSALAEAIRRDISRARSLLAG